MTNRIVRYMKLLDIPVGLSINSHEKKLADDIHRMIRGRQTNENFTEANEVDGVNQERKSERHFYSLFPPLPSVKPPKEVSEKKPTK